MRSILVKNSLYDYVDNNSSLFSRIFVEPNTKNQITTHDLFDILVYGLKKEIEHTGPQMIMHKYASQYLYYEYAIKGLRSDVTPYATMQELFQILYDNDFLEDVPEYGSVYYVPEKDRTEIIICNEELLEEYNTFDVQNFDLKSTIRGLFSAPQEASLDAIKYLAFRKSDYDSLYNGELNDATVRISDHWNTSSSNIIKGSNRKPIQRSWKMASLDNDTGEWVVMKEYPRGEIKNNEQKIEILDALIKNLYKNNAKQLRFLNSEKQKINTKYTRI